MSKDPGPDVAPSGYLGAPRAFTYDEVRLARDQFYDVIERWPYSLRRVRDRFGSALAVPTETVNTWHVVIFVYKKRHMKLARRLVKKHMAGTPTSIQLSDIPVAL